MRGRARTWTTALGALGMLASARTAHASPEDLFGYGARTSAMGATGVAHASGYESSWHNAALASPEAIGKGGAPKPENVLTLGYVGGVFRLSADRRVATTPARGFLIGASVPIPFGGVLRDRVGVSLGFYTPSDVIVRGRVLYPETPQFPILADRAQSLMIRAALGANIGHGVRVGVGVAALAEIVGTVVAAVDATGRVGTRVENQLVATYAPTLGATYDLPGASRVRVGLTYRGELDARFQVVVDGSKLSSLQIPLLNISGLAQYDPAQVALEVARLGESAGPLPTPTLAAQIVYKRWSGFPGVLEPTVVCSEGGAGACGTLPPVIGWRDTFVVRVGAEQGLPVSERVSLRGRVGAFFESSPLPPEVPTSEAYASAAGGNVTLPTRYYDADRLAVTAGVGLALARPLPPVALDLWAQHHVLVPREIRSGDETASATGFVSAFGMTAGVRF